jgi:hypothetical protein
MASSVAAKLTQEDNVQVKIERVGPGEFSVTVDGGARSEKRVQGKEARCAPVAEAKIERKHCTAAPSSELFSIHVCAPAQRQRKEGR